MTCRRQRATNYPAVLEYFVSIVVDILFLIFNEFDVSKVVKRDVL
jgi:hypothetical protein